MPYDRHLGLFISFVRINLCTLARSVADIAAYINLYIRAYNPTIVYIPPPRHINRDRTIYKDIHTIRLCILYIYVARSYHMYVIKRSTESRYWPNARFIFVFFFFFFFTLNKHIYGTMLR